MTNIIGPHGTGINETTTRPTDTASGSPVDTWFQPCINGDPNTGTKIPAVWLNKVTALLRRAIRGMSVPEDELDDDMLLKAIKQTLPLLVNGTTPIGQLTASSTGDGSFKPDNLISKTQTVTVNVASLTTSPMLRNGFAQVTVNARASLDDAQEWIQNAHLKCTVVSAGRAIDVATEELDTFASTSDNRDWQETGGEMTANYTFLVPLSNGSGSFEMKITTYVETGEVTGWSAHMKAFLDAVFPRL